jgi:hypothetical protein
MTPVMTTTGRTGERGGDMAVSFRVVISSRAAESPRMTAFYMRRQKPCFTYEAHFEKSSRQRLILNGWRTDYLARTSHPKEREVERLLLRYARLGEGEI